MKPFLTAILAFSFLVSTAQQLKYKSADVDSIVITAEVGAYQFDKCTFKSTGETLLIGYNRQLNIWQTEKCYVTSSVYETENEITKERTKNLKNQTGRKVDSTCLKQLLTALSGEDTTDMDYIDSAQWKLLVTEKRIRSYAKKRDLDWHFKPRYSSAEENNQFFESCKSYDTLKLYLWKRFALSPNSILFDYYNSFWIEVYTQNKMYNYEGTFSNHLRQPWYDLSVTTSDIWDMDGYIFNLNINKSLEKILPDDFLLKYSISLEGMIDDYLTWYFERRNID